MSSTRHSLNTFSPIGRCGRAPISCRRRSTPDGEAWRVWLILGGRGAGKTRAGAEWVRAKALGRVAHGGRASHRARRRNVCRCAAGDDRGRIRLAGRAPCKRAAALRALEGTGGVEVGRAGADLLRRRPRQLARAAVRCRLVRRGRQVAASGAHLGHAAVRAAPGRASADGGDDDAARHGVLEEIARRRGHRGDAGGDGRQRRQPGADVRCRDDAPLRRHGAGAAGAVRRHRRRHLGRPVAA